MNENQPRNKPTSPEQRRIRMFNAVEIGKSLTEVAVDLIKSEDRNIESRWYHSPLDADLFFWRDERKNIIKQQVTFFGQIVEWNVVEGVRTGVLIEDGADDQKGQSPIIRFDAKTQAHTVDQGLKIIENITSLRAEDRSRLLDNFVKSPRLLSLGVEEVLKKYGNYMTSPGTSWFERLLLAIGFKKKK